LAGPRDIHDPFYRQLYPILLELIDERMVSLAQGAAEDYPAYRGQVGFIEACNVIMQKCDDIAGTLYETISDQRG